VETSISFEALFPLVVVFIPLVVVLAKMHSDIDVIKEKLKVLFELWNKDK